MRVEVAKFGDGDRARQVPAAVLVVEAVVGEADEDLRRAGGGVVAGGVLVADEAVGEGEIEPGLLRGVGVESEIVGVAEVLEVGDDVGELVGLRVPAVEDVERARACCRRGYTCW